jgi:hypothetical protein
VEKTTTTMKVTTNSLISDVNMGKGEKFRSVLQSAKTMPTKPEENQKNPQ